MGSNTTSRKLDLKKFPWEMKFDDIRMTFLENVFCLTATETMLIWIIFSVELFVICLAIYGLCCLFQTNHSVPIFVTNLFISDFLQICIRPLFNFCTFSIGIAILYYMYSMSITANIEFMVCISLERYIMIKYPVWYRQHNTTKNSLLICLLAWGLTLACMLIDVCVALIGEMEHIFIVTVFLLLLPYPVVVFCFVGTWRVLAKSVAVSTNERKKILRVLALVLFNYTILFMPTIVQSGFYALSFEYSRSLHYLSTVSSFLVYLNPLADALLYVFLRKDANIVLKCLCCEGHKQSDQTQRLNSSNSLSRRSEVQSSVQICAETTLT